MQLSIQTRLFLSFTLLSSVLVASSSYLYFTQASKDLSVRMEETNRQQLYRYQEALDNIVEDMDRISAQVIYNSDIKDYLIDHDEDPSSFQSFSKRKKYEELLASFNGPWFIAAQINLLKMDGFFLTYGQNMDTVPDIERRIQQSLWLKEALDLDGDKLLIPPHESEWQDNHPLYFSLVRSFNFPQAFSPAAVEVQQPFSLLSATMEIGRNEHSTAQVYVINENREIFYPYYSTEDDHPKIPNWIGSIKEVARVGGGLDIWSQVKSEFSGLTVLIQQPKSEVMQPISNLRRITFILALLGEAISIVIAYVLSVGIASPIRYLQTRLQKLTFDNLKTSKVKKMQNIKEIAMLYATFEEMRNRLNNSLDEVIQSQKRENIAHLHAMYAQMNPHFLFNTLTAMASYAEESGFREYALVSQQLSGMLRYSTNSMSHSVTVKQEIHYTVQYMELMQFRYEGQFTYSIQVDSHLEDEPIPKFLLQPLVENSFAHGFQLARPPWIIEVSVTNLNDNQTWEIKITDNGSGFTETAFSETQDLIKELNDGQIRRLESLSTRGLGKMGIVNTLTRCRLFWNENVSFSLNRCSQGMEFIITVRREFEDVSNDPH